MWCEDCTRDVKFSNQNTLTVTVFQSDEVKVKKKNILKITLSKCRKCKTSQARRIVKFSDE